jgi:hypothetical protein
MTTTSTGYTVALGTTVAGGQVHIAHGTGGRPLTQLCRFGRNADPITETIATLTEDGGQAETLDALLLHMIPMSRLCKNCFAPRTREAYRGRIRAAAAACQDEPEQPADEAPAVAETAPAALDVAHLEFGTAYLIAPTGARYAVIDGGYDDQDRAYVWLVAVDAAGIRTGTGRRKRLRNDTAAGWAIEGAEREITITIDTEGGVARGSALIYCQADERLDGIAGTSEGKAYVETHSGEFVTAADRRSALRKLARKFGYTRVVFEAES